MKKVKAKVEVRGIDTFLVCEIDTVLDGVRTYEIAQEQVSEEPFSSTTCTSNMHEFIGNVVSIGRERCVVRGVYYGKMCEVPNVKIIDKKVNRIGQRVMGTEHLAVNGNLEIVASTKPILQNNINFINFGWKTKDYFRQLRIDIYTGESVEIK